MALSRSLTNLNTETKLANGISAVETNVVVVDPSSYPAAPFAIAIDEEVMEVTGVAQTTFTVTRGFGGTTAVAHGIGAPVRQVLIAEDFADIDTRLVAVEGGGGVDSFTLKRVGAGYLMAPWNGDTDNQGVTISFTDRAFFYAIVAPFDCTVDDLVMLTTGFGAGESFDAEIGIFNQHPTEGGPGTLVQKATGSFSGAASNVTLTLAPALALTGGTVYWVGFRIYNRVGDFLIHKIGTSTGETAGGYQIGDDGTTPVSKKVAFQDTTNLGLVDTSLADMDSDINYFYPVFLRVAS